MADVSRRLLGRDGVAETSAAASALVAGRRVVVTGAAGSIGSELVRQMNRLGAHVYLLDHDESRLHGLHLELSGSGLLDTDTVVLADIRDRPRLMRTFERLRPDVVFHAAAHKHLQLLERAPSEAVKTNVYGTQNVVDAALAAGAERMVLISTDKAADPSSVLGASKLLSEYVMQGTAHHGMRVASVRFGNVLGSRGSLLDTLRWQLANGLPVTITDRDVTRFFMSIPEAVGLVLEAGLMAEHGETYVFDMGEPIRIVDLVERFSALTGWPIESIVYSGLRPGEKLHEVLAATHEEQRSTAHPRISVIPTQLTGARIDVLFDLLPVLYRAALHDDDDFVGPLLTDGVADLRAPLDVWAPRDEVLLQV
ncbi:MAG: SDR family NAD(P)-dependent oxidoreductase [Acidimicrobiales bacterium]|nr:SDR family NAD(P)-dependent oxidoreductase [Acidimicrobiales bacterium]MCB9395303.1 SDR family NAD(P)-dependent oxidoreductase [Acidimicrobiaceae bacterium]